MLPIVLNRCLTKKEWNHRDLNDVISLTKEYSLSVSRRAATMLCSRSRHKKDPWKWCARILNGSPSCAMKAGSTFNGNSSRETVARNVFIKQLKFYERFRDCRVSVHRPALLSEPHTDSTEFRFSNDRCHELRFPSSRPLIRYFLRLVCSSLHLEILNKSCMVRVPLKYTFSKHEVFPRWRYLSYVAEC